MGEHFRGLAPEIQAFMPDAYGVAADPVYLCGLLCNTEILAAMSAAYFRIVLVAIPGSIENT